MCVVEEGRMDSKSPGQPPLPETGRMPCSTRSAARSLLPNIKVQFTNHTAGQNADCLCPGLYEAGSQSQQEGKLLPCSSQRGQGCREQMGEEGAELRGAPLQYWAAGDQGRRGHVMCDAVVMLLQDHPDQSSAAFPPNAGWSRDRSDCPWPHHR